jgi:Ca2+-binding RTX toxin-like protein
VGLFSRLVRLSVATCGALVLVSAISAYAAANNVSGSKVVDYRTAITANALKPSECASLSLSNIITGRGDFNGTSGNDLILGSEIADTVDASGGNDCIVGGTGEDVLDGGNGNDMLLGGGDSDDLDGGAGTDVCYRGGGDQGAYHRCEQER